MQWDNSESFSLESFFPSHPQWVRYKESSMQLVLNIVVASFRFFVYLFVKWSPSVPQFQWERIRLACCTPHSYLAWVYIWVEFGAPMLFQAWAELVHLGWDKGKTKAVSHHWQLDFPQRAADPGEFHPPLPKETAEPQWQLLWFPGATEPPSSFSHWCGCPSKCVCACLETKGVNSLESDWEQRLMDSQMDRIKENSPFNTQESGVTEKWWADLPRVFKLLILQSILVEKEIIYCDSKAAVLLLPHRDMRRNWLLLLCILHFDYSFFTLYPCLVIRVRFWYCDIIGKDPAMHKPCLAATAWSPSH